MSRESRGKGVPVPVAESPKKEVSNDDLPSLKMEVSRMVSIG